MFSFGFSNYDYTGEVYCKNFMNSIKGIIRPSEFEMHVTYLVSLASYATCGVQERETFRYYEYFETKVNTSPKFKTDFEIKLAKEFLEYVKYRRGNKTRLELDQDVETLRYSIKIQENEEYYTEVSKIFDKLFSLTKSLFWKVQTYYWWEGKDTAMDVFYNRVKNTGEELTLEEALRAVCVLNLENNIDDLLRGLKTLLLVYHPDKNRHERSREVYEKVERIYRAVNTILKKYESHYEDTIFCELREFLGWKLKDIEGDKIYSHMVLMERPLGYKCKKELKEYHEIKTVISDTENNLLKKYREIIGIEQRLLDMVILCPNPTKLKGTDEGFNVNKVEEDRLKLELKNRRGSLKEEKSNQKHKRELLAKELSQLTEILESNVRCLIEICAPLCHEFKNEIVDHELIQTENSFSEYAKQKRIMNLKDKLTRLNNEEAEARIFLSNVRIKRGYNFIKDHPGQGILSGGWTLIKNIPNALNNVSNGVKVIRSYGSKLWNKCNIRTEYDYFGEYWDLFEKYENLMKTIKACDVRICENNEYVFYCLTRVEIGNEAATSMGDHDPHFPHCSVTTFTKCKHCFKGEIRQLESESKVLECRYKDEYDVEKHHKDIILVTKEMKQKVNRNSKDIEQLKNRKEIEETKADVAESKAEEERKGRQNAEKKAAIFKTLLMQVKSGEVPLSVLKGVDLDNFHGALSSNESEKDLAKSD